MVWLESLPDDWWNEYQGFLLSPLSIQELRIEILFLARCVLLEARTYARVCQRTRLSSRDFQVALEARHIHLDVNLAQSESRQVQTTTMSLSSMIDRMDPFAGRFDGIKLTMHWLAIDGEQPIIAENPMPDFSHSNVFHTTEPRTNDTVILSPLLADQSPSLQKLFGMASDVATSRRSGIKQTHHVHPLTMNNLPLKPIHPRHAPVRRSYMASTLAPTVPSLAHELSAEQQLYFKMLTETCFNGTQQQRTNAFRCLSSDAALQPLLPRLVVFITKGIQINIHLRDLRFIIRFLSMLKMLTINPHIAFDKYLHLIVSSLFTCLLCVFDLPKNPVATVGSAIDKTSSNGYSTVWIVREQASDLLSHFEKRFSTIPHLTERMVFLLKSALTDTTTARTFSMVYACAQTWLSMDAHRWNATIFDIIEEHRRTSVLECDFDLDPAEQEALFNRKIHDLLQKYNLTVRTGNGQ